MNVRRLVRMNKHRVMIILGSVMLTSLVLSGHFVANDEQRQARTATFVDVGGETRRTTLH